ncbi:hypothetical protein HYU10_01910 [Candidatus Woesearchaeota archaeon]|nr:hypothetical protein [Candidatus Woesearchaeota archaeon]
MYEIIIGRKESDRVKFGLDGTIFLGKQYVQMGQTTSLSNKVYMDVTRSHVVFIAGKRGSGKCLHGDTFVTLDNGLEVPIRDLCDYKNNNIMGLSHDLKIIPGKKTEFFKRKVSDLLHIRLRSGREIKLTPEHPLLTVAGWRPSCRLGAGERIATPRKISSFGSAVQQECDVKILAYMISEGHTKKSMFFSNKDEKIIRDMQNSLKGLDEKISLVRLKEGHYKVSYRNYRRKVLGYKINRDIGGKFSIGTSITHEKTKIRELLEKHGIYNLLSKEKFLSDEIMQYPKNRLSLFLNRLFSCDGSIYKPQKDRVYWEISYSTSSLKLARQIQSLLLRFEILARLRHKKIKCRNKLFDSFELVLDGNNVEKYIQDIGFFGQKEERQNAALLELKSAKRNPNVDTIPKEMWDFYRPRSWASAGRHLNYKSPKAARSSMNYSPSRQKLLQIAMADDNYRMLMLAQSDIFWDEIVSIENLRGEFTVYDITVPEIHNFVANNIIVHNSYTMGAIAEGIFDLPEAIKNKLSIIMLDTMGVYWTMKYPNNKEKPLLDQWEIEPKGLNIQIFTPAGYFKSYKDQGIPTDYPFSVKPSDIDASEWVSIFEIPPNDSVAVLIERVINEMKEEGKEFDIHEIIEAVHKDDRVTKDVKDAAENKFLLADKWGLFSKEGTMIEHLVVPGQVTVLDVSCYASMAGASSLRALVVGLVAEKLFIQRMVARKAEELQSVTQALHFFSEEQEKESSEPLVWLVLDEAHEFLPREGTTSASQSLITILREGRQPGISLVLATQQPGKIHTDVITQSDIVISHRLTANLDVEALSMLVQSYMREGIDKQLNLLPRESGAAVIFDDTNERIFPIRVRPRYTWHGGESPTAMAAKQKIFEF